MNFCRLCILEKRGDEIKKKSSPLKLLCQSQPNSAEMILGWSPFKIVSKMAAITKNRNFFKWPKLLYFKIFFKFHPPFFLFLAWRPFRLEVGITGHNFGRGPCKDYSTKVWLQLAQWFLRRRLLCEFPIGSYVKLSSAVGTILVEGPNRRTHFCKRTIQ